MTTSEVTSQAAAPVLRSRAAPYASYTEVETTCAECSAAFRTRNRKKLFCSKEHKVAFHNRCKARGQVLVPLAMAWRGPRGTGDTAKQAMFEMCNALDAWRREDREAGRMPMEQVVGRGFERGQRKVFCR